MARRLLKNSFIDVILLTFDKNLGEKYDIVKVKPIFARNVLLPKGIAILATSMNVHNYAVKISTAKKEKEDNKIVWALAIIGAIAAVAGIAFAVYKYLTPDYMDDFDEDFDDDFDDDFFDEEDDTDVKEEDIEEVE